MAALKLDPFVQRTLLDLADADRVIGAANHRRRTLPELAVISAGSEQVAAARRAVLMAETEVSDLHRATNKLDNEVEQVRARAKRDNDRLISGSAGAKELENLQREIESLRRRQGVLEDEELELMEQRETAESLLAAGRRELAELQARVSAAEAERDRQFALIDAQIADQEADRQVVTNALPADVLTLYTRIHDSGKVAAGRLVGSECSACRIEIDRTALGEIRSAPIDAIVRCTECGAILIRA